MIVENAKNLRHRVFQASKTLLQCNVIYGGLKARTGRLASRQDRLSLVRHRV